MRVCVRVEPQWLRSLPASLGLDLDQLEAEEGLCGSILKRAVESTRELKELFGLHSLEARLDFEQALLRAIDGELGQPGDGEVSRLLSALLSADLRASGTSHLL